MTGAIDAFQNGTVIASSFKTVLLTSLISTNGGDKFGFIADVGIASLKVLKQHPFTYKPTQSGTQGIDDFEVRIV